MNQIIQSRQRFRPFTHTPGLGHLLPGTNLYFKVFPARAEAWKIGEKEPFRVWGTEAPPEGQFTVLTDLHRRSIQVRRGVHVYEILPADQDGFQVVASAAGRKPFQAPLLSFGCHKAQQWDAIRQRCDMREILPLWYLYGKLIGASADAPQGTLLRNCQEVAEREDVFPAFKTLYQAGFSPAFVPRIFDEDYHGFVDPPAEDELSILRIGAQVIEGLFIRYHEGNLSLLPLLPPECHSGHLVGLQIEGLGMVSLEWSKRTIRRLIIVPSRSGTVQLKLQNSIDRYRLQRQKSISRDESLELTAGCTLYFDKFEK